jgi:WD repeat-containing protein 19
MVLTLEKLMNIEDRLLLSGYVHMLFSRFDEAEDCLLKSSRPIVALEMRTDLLQWEHAIKLAEALAPERLPSIAIKYGQQCEYRGQWQKALQNYQNARNAEDQLTEQERAAIYEGIAKTNLRLGDVRRGREMAIESGNKQLCADCAKILAQMKTMNVDAAALYIRAEEFEKAASLFISDKKFDQAQPLMAKISTPKLHIEYAHAKEDTVRIRVLSSCCWCWRCGADAGAGGCGVVCQRMRGCSCAWKVTAAAAVLLDSKQPRAACF